MRRKAAARLRAGEEIEKISRKDAKAQRKTEKAH
jgi:hypothetical protein